jgi:hypothetical protein
MSFGFPAYSSGSQNFTLGEQELADTVGEALRVLGWPYENPLPNKFVARISMSLWSWGERLIVDIAHDGTITANSECAFPLQCVDWGRNGWNVRSFFDEVSRIASTHANSKPSTNA